MKQQTHTLGECLKKTELAQPQAKGLPEAGRRPDTDLSLASSTGTFILDFYPLELQSKFLLFKPLWFVALCYSSPSKPIDQTKIPIEVNR